MEMRRDLEDLAAAEPVGFSVNLEDLPVEGGQDPAFGTVSWRTLVCGERTQSSDMVLGVAEFGAFGTLLPHRHPQAEFYFGLSGDGVVTLGGVPHRIAAGVAVYVPREAEHGVVAGPEGLRFAYGFAADRFGDVTYRFSAHHL